MILGYRYERSRSRRRSRTWASRIFMILFISRLQSFLGVVHAHYCIKFGTKLIFLAVGEEIKLLSAPFPHATNPPCFLISVPSVVLSAWLLSGFRKDQRPRNNQIELTQAVVVGAEQQATLT